MNVILYSKYIFISDNRYIYECGYKKGKKKKKHEHDIDMDLNINDRRKDNDKDKDKYMNKLYNDIM